jgi:hypothetical protein
MFKYVILVSGLLISACAAWFSVSGISQLFIGAPVAAMAMAIALEIGKLVSVSFIYRNWNSVSKLLRIYLLVGSVILSIVTSIGIYGYLSAAYASAAVGYNSQQNEISLLDTRQKTLTSQIDANNTRIQQIQQYRSQQENRLDSLVGKSGFLTQQKTIRQASEDVRVLQQQVSALLVQRDSLEIKKVQYQNKISTDGKLGTFWYVAKTFNTSLDTIVKWFILIIVFVFDPLALSLLISYNHLSNTTKKPEITVSEEIPTEPTPEPVEEIIPTPEPVPDVVQPIPLSGPPVRVSG